MNNSNIFGEFPDKGRNPSNDKTRPAELPYLDQTHAVRGFPTFFSITSIRNFAVMFVFRAVTGPDTTVKYRYIALETRKYQSVRTRNALFYRFWISQSIWETTNNVGIFVKRS